MEKIKNIAVAGLFAFAFIVLIFINWAIVKQSNEIERTTPLEKPNIPAIPPQQLSALADSIKKTLQNKPQSFVKGIGWHELNSLSREWSTEELYVHVMYYMKSDKNPEELFVISFPKRNIDNLPGLSDNELKILGLGGFGQDISFATKTFAVGQRIISGFGVIHIIKDIIVDEEADIVTFDPSILEAESDNNYLFITRTDALIERINIQR